MKRRLLFMLIVMGGALSIQAQGKKMNEKVAEGLKSIKISGYGIVQYQGNDKKDAEQNSFALRIGRVSLESHPHKDFYAKVQMQITGNTSESASAIRLVDLFGEWQKYSFAKIKAGQFKRPFTFENPMHPITQGFMSYAQGVSKLSGFNDRTGEQASNGRDIGLQIQGDLLPVNGRALLHYQVGVFNGQGINVKDADNRKDIIGGIWVMPIDGLRIGTFGWSGSRGIKDANGKVVSLPKNRYSLSAEYVQDDWTIRSEYIHSQGFASLSHNKSDKADGFYALAIAPIIKEKLHVKTRYDLYRDEATWSSSKTMYEVGADYMFTKNLQINLEYARVNERATHENYNLVDVEMSFKF
jgi:hypothetical protein